METRISQLEKDYGTVFMVISKFDKAIEKLTDFSGDVSQLLAVQDKRLEILEKSLEKMEFSADSRRSEAEQKLQKFYEQMHDIEDNVKSQLEVHKKAICDKLDVMQTEYKKQDAEQDKRIHSLERWKWLLMGAGVVIGFLINAFISII
jgi:DNA-binding protein H-NS